MVTHARDKDITTCSILLLIPRFLTTILLFLNILFLEGKWSSLISIKIHADFICLLNDYLDKFSINSSFQCEKNKTFTNNVILIFLQKTRYSAALNKKCINLHKTNIWQKFLKVLWAVLAEIINVDKNLYTECDACWNWYHCTCRCCYRSTWNEVIQNYQDDKVINARHLNYVSNSHTNRISCSMSTEQYWRQTL
jgi:hypothetical protein